MRIPITMCHGIYERGKNPISPGRFRQYVAIAAELGFESISYDQLEIMRKGTGTLPERPIMFDFDHPAKSMRYEIHDTLAEFGYRGNLFVQTGALAEVDPIPLAPGQEAMTWDDLAGLVERGWLIGAHTVTHPNLSKLLEEDPAGERLRAELEECDATLKSRLGITPRDFAFTGTSWSSVAEREVKKRYRFGRLWIIGSEYEVDGEKMRYAELVGVEGEDEADGGPPAAARYITERTDPYRLPSMELQGLIWEPEAFRRYLEGALS